MNITRNCSYDKFNRLSTYYEGKKENPTDSEKIRYEYNDKDQVVKIDYPEAAKNIKSVLYEYNNQMKVVRIKAITSSGTTAKTVREYTYSPKGNVATIKDYTGFDTGSGEYILRTYTYDSLGRLINVKVTDRANNNNISQKSHTYDEEGQIIKSQISVSKGEQTKTQTVINTYNGSGERIEKELRFNDENGNEVSEKTLYYVVNDSILYTENVIKNNNEKEEKSITSQNIIAPNGSVISTLRDKEYFIYNADMKGSTTSISSPDGSYKLVYAYDIYGEPVRRGDKDFYNEITFTGAVYDEETGLFYLSSRYYDPTTGRFTSTDEYQGELDNPISLNGYIYCNDNPVKYTDNDGHVPTIIIGAAVGALIGGGVEFVSQVASGNGVDWTKVAIEAGSGAVDGAITSSGMGPAASFAASVANGMITNMGEQTAYNSGDINYKEVANAGIEAGIVAGIDLGTGKTLQKLTKKSNKIINNEFTKNGKKIKNVLKRKGKKGLSKVKKIVKKFKKIKKHIKKIGKTIRKYGKNLIKSVIKSKAVQYSVKVAKKVIKKSKKVFHAIKKRVTPVVRRIRRAFRAPVRKFFSFFRRRRRR